MGGQMPMPMPMPPGGGSPFGPIPTVSPEAAMGQLPQLDPMTMMLLLQQAGDPMAMAEAGRGSAQGYGEQGMSPLVAAMMQMGVVPAKTVM